jgi:WD40 repeat protein
VRAPDGTMTLGEEETFPHAGRGTLLKAIDAEGNWFLQHFEDGRIVVWPQGDASRGRTLHTTRAIDLNITVSADGAWGASWFNYGSDIVTFWSAREPAVAPRKLSVVGWRFVDFSPDGGWLLASNTREAMTWRLPDLTPGPGWSAPPDGDLPRTVGFSPDGRWLASARSRNVLEIRDTQTWEVVIRLDAPTDFQRCAWSADGNELYLLDVVGGETRLFRWNLPALRNELAARGLDW